MKTLSLKMLLIAALVVSPVAMATGETSNNAQPQPVPVVVTEGYVTRAGKFVTETATTTGKAVTGTVKTVGAAIGTAGKAVIGFPAQAWTEFKEAGLLTKFAVLAAAGYVGEKTYNYVTTPAQTKTVKA
jgi:hypothetical protein